MKRSIVAAVVAAAALCLSAWPVHADGPQSQPMDFARAAWARGAHVSRRIASLLDEARRTGDALRTQCLDDALSRVDAQLRLIQARSERLEAATTAHDAPGVARELRLLHYVARLLPETEVLADACIGVVRHADVREETVVEVEVPTDVPEYTDVRPTSR